MIDFYRIKSILTQVTEKNMADYTKAVSDELGEQLQCVELEQFIKDDFALLYVASGGSENYFLQIFDQIKDRPCYILTSGDSNSLAASMEIMSYINNHGSKGEIIHGDVKKVAQRIKTLKAITLAKKNLAGKNYGSIGKPSDWLIASDFDPKAVEEKLGMKYVYIDIQELIDETNKKQYIENEFTAQIKTKGFNADEVEKALYIYGACKRICEKYNLAAVTIRCFDLLDTVCSTGCLALAILNAEGIYGGCEGDVPSLLTMLIAGTVTGERCFLCNPSRFDTEKGTAVFAHCTLPLDMLKDYKLNTHYESGIGVAIQGTFEERPVTIVKCSGNLDRHHQQEGQIIPHEFSTSLCRTQIKLHLDDFSYFLTNPINNHHIIIFGNHQDELNAFFESL